MYVASKSRLFGLEFVHMARYKLILRLDGALRLRIIYRPLLIQKLPIIRSKRPTKSQKCKIIKFLYLDRWVHAPTDGKDSVDVKIIWSRRHDLTSRLQEHLGYSRSL